MAWIKSDLLSKIKALFVEKAQGSSNANKTLSTDASGNVILEAKNNHTHAYVPTANIKNDLTTGGASNVLSAEQGKTLNTNKLAKNTDDTSTGYITAKGFKVTNATSGHFVKADGSTAAANNYSHPSTQQCTHNHNTAYLSKTGNDTSSGTITATGFKVGTQTGFLKANGTVDNSTYNNYSHPSTQQCTHNHDSAYIAKGTGTNFVLANGTTKAQSDFATSGHTHQTLESASLADLSTLITNTPTNGVIVLDRDYKGATGNSTITINKNITIIGNGHTIDVNKITRLFNINANCKLVLDNVKIINGYISSYGGVFHNTGTLEIHNCTIANNEAASDGGVINVQSGNTIITDSLFANNKTGTSNKGGVINNFSSNANLTIMNCTFVNNGAQNGSVISNSSATSCNVYDCIFANNTASNQGTIWSNNANIQLHRCVFKNNTAGSYASIYSSAAITVYNCVFDTSSNPTYNVTHRTYSLDNHNHDSTYAPKAHSVNANTYGLGTTGVYGHVKVINALNKTAYADGEALSAYQGKLLQDAINGKQAAGNYATSGHTHTSWTNVETEIVDAAHGYLYVNEAIKMACYKWAGSFNNANTGTKNIDTIPSTYRPTNSIVTVLSLNPDYFSTLYIYGSSESNAGKVYAYFTRTGQQTLGGNLLWYY